MNWIARLWVEQAEGDPDPEYGERRIVEVYGVVVESRRGRRMLYVGPVDTPDATKAVLLVTRINKYIKAHPSWEPRDRYWTEIFPVYGSDYYVESGEEENVAAMERNGWGE